MADVFNILDTPPSGGGFDSYFSGADTVGGTDISSGFTDVPLDSENAKNNITHTGSSAVATIVTAGTYKITYQVGVEIDPVSVDRQTAETRLMVDVGAGFVEVDGAHGWIYLRDQTTQTDNKQSVSASAILTLAAGDDIKVQAARVALASGTLRLEANSSGLSIHRVA